MLPELDAIPGQCHYQAIHNHLRPIGFRTPESATYVLPRSWIQGMNGTQKPVNNALGL